MIDQSKMFKNIVMKIKFLATLLVFVASVNAALAQDSDDTVAEFGTVTINGKTIPPLHFQAYIDFFRYDKDEFCPPSSNALFRDQVIALWLRDLEAASTDSISDKTRQRLQGLAKKHRADSGLEGMDLAAYELRAKSIVAKAMNTTSSNKSTDADIINHYRQMIKAGHPLLTNVTLIRRRELALRAAVDLEIASKMVADGEGIDAIAEKLGRPADNKFQADDWYALNTFDYELGDDITPGTLYGPLDAGNRQVIVYVEDIKKVSRIRPSTRVNNEWRYAITRTESDLRFQRRYGAQDEQLAQLWEKYAVLEDGEPLVKPSSYMRCGK